MALLWSLVLALGGLVMLIFSVTNGFLPELDFSGALSLLAGAALVSFFLIFAVSMMTFAGGCTLYSWFEDIDFKTRGKMSVLFALLSASAAYLVMIVLGNAPESVRIVALTILGLMVVWCCVVEFRRYKGCNLGLCKETLLAAGSILIGTLFAFLNGFVFMKLYRGYPGVEDVTQWAVLAIWLMTQAVCIGAVASSRTPAALFKISSAFGFVGLFLLLVLSNNSTFLVQRMAQMLGIGAMPSISLAVTHKGCQVLGVLSNGVLCTPVSDKSVYLVGPITLRSRFGKQVLIEYTSYQNASSGFNNISYEAVLEASEVLGWQRF